MIVIRAPERVLFTDAEAFVRGSRDCPVCGQHVTHHRQGGVYALITDYEELHEVHYWCPNKENTMDKYTLMDRLISAACQHVASEKGDVSSAHYDAQLELTEEMLDEAAGAYVDALADEREHEDMSHEDLTGHACPLCTAPARLGDSRLKDSDDLL